MDEKHQCAGWIWGGLHGHQCAKSGTIKHEDKYYCKTHHPPTKKANDDERYKRWEAKWAAQDKARADAAKVQAELERKAAAYDRLVAWLETYEAEASKIGMFEDGTYSNDFVHGIARSTRGTFAKNVREILEA